MQVTLQFLSERLRMLPLQMLQQLVPSLQLQQCEQHSLIFNRDDDATTFYVVLSGVVPLVHLHTSKPKARQNPAKREGVAAFLLGSVLGLVTHKGPGGKTGTT